MPLTVLVTGVSRHLGARVAESLARHPSVARVIGLDVTAPTEELGWAEFVRADIRNPVVGRILDQAKVDTVVHLALSTGDAHGRERASQKEANVIGTMQLLAACQSTPSLRRIVLRSTCDVYGSSPHDPSLFTEDQQAPRARARGPVRDALEVEGYLRAARRRRPDLESATLRLAHVVGPDVRSPLLQYLSAPVVAVPLGFDPRLQVLHEDDAVAALVLAVTGPPAGVVNVAADGVVTLRQAAALAGRPVVLVPTHTGRLLGGLAALGGSPAFNPAVVDYLRYGRALDTSRAKERLGFAATWNTRDAFLDAAAAFPPPVPGVDAVRGWVGSLGTAVGQAVRQARELGG